MESQTFPEMAYSQRPDKRMTDPAVPQRTYPSLEKRSLRNVSLENLTQTSPLSFAATAEKWEMGLDRFQITIAS